MADIGIAGIVTVFALGDMIIYNRKKRTEWMEGQHAQRRELLQAAYQAAATGTADEDQMLLINQERAAEAAAQARMAKGGLLKRTKRFLFSGLSNEDATLDDEKTRERDPRGALGGEVWKESTSDNSGETRDQLGIIRAVEDIRRDPKRPQVRGGPLDELAENVVTSASEKSSSWTSWMVRR